MIIKLNIITEKAEVDTPAVQLQKDREDLQRSAVESIENDETVHALKERFDARILPGTIEPVAQQDRRNT